MASKQTAEQQRLEAARERIAHWKLWGPYLAERAWATVREDYSPYGSAWDYFPHDHARSRTYRWNEDGLAGICDEQQRLCFALALWNGNDPILKERLFGLTGNEGNHAEDVKEYYFYLDSTPTHSYMKMLYKYPQAAFPYADLVETNRRRSKADPEYELSHRLMRIFLHDDDGRRAVFGGNERFQHDPQWRDYVLFYEYFHGDSGAGVGASHQTGWTGLVAKLIQQQGEHHTMPAIETAAAAV